MSQANVDLVLALQPAPDADLAQLFRDEGSWAQLAAALAPALAPDCECLTHGFPGNEGAIVVGVDGLRSVFLEWLAPWASYRTEIEHAIDAGERVVVLVRDFARRAPDTNEIALTSAAVWTVCDGTVTRIEFCSERTTALAIAGVRG